MPKLTIRRTIKNSDVRLDAWVNGIRQVGFDSATILPELFPLVQVMNGGIMLTQLNLRMACNGSCHYKSFMFGHEIKSKSDPFPEVQTELMERIGQVAAWVKEVSAWAKSIPVVEEFTIEI